MKQSDLRKIITEEVEGMLSMLGTAMAEAKGLKLKVEVPMRDPEIKKFIHNYLLLNKKYSMTRMPEYSMKFGGNKWNKETHWKFDTANNILYVHDEKVVDQLVKGGAPSDLFESNLNENKGQDLADKYVAILRKEFRKLNDDELDEFRKTIAQAFDLKESVNEGSGIPSNIEKFAKQKGVLADIKQIARWAKKAGLGIRGGTAIGKGYDTLVLDLTYKGAEIYYDTYKGTIKVNRQPVNSWKTFSKAVNESMNEAEFKHISKDEHKIKLAIKDVEKKSRLKANRDKTPEYEQEALNKIMLSKVLGREKLSSKYKAAWEKLKKEYSLKESKTMKKNKPLNEVSTISKKRAGAELKQKLKGKRSDGLGKYTATIYGMDGGKRVELKDLNDLNKYSEFEIDESVDEGLSSSDIRKATETIKKYVKKLGSKANGTSDQVAINISKILGWTGSKIDQLEDYLRKINGGSEEMIFEAKLSKIYNAAKKGSYPVTLVVIENGKVVKQELVGTPQIVPAAFNQLKKEYPKATVHVEDKTGLRLFSESVNETKLITEYTDQEILDMLLKSQAMAKKESRPGLVKSLHKHIKDLENKIKLSKKESVNEARNFKKAKQALIDFNNGKIGEDDMVKSVVKSLGFKFDEFSEEEAGLELSSKIKKGKIPTDNYILNNVIDVLSESVNEGVNEIRKGDYIGTGKEIGLVNKVSGSGGNQVAYVKFDSRPKSFIPILARNLTKTGKKHKGKDLYQEGIVNEKAIKGKDAGNYIKMAPKGRKLHILGTKDGSDQKDYISLGKGKWQEKRTGEKLNWIELSAITSALGDTKVFYEGKLNEAVKPIKLSGNLKKDLANVTHMATKMVKYAKDNFNTYIPTGHMLSQLTVAGYKEKDVLKYNIAHLAKAINTDLKKNYMKDFMAESVNEMAESQIKKISELTGVSIDKVEKYVSSRVLNITKLLKYIKDEKQVAIRDFEKAVNGDKKQDTYFIKMFNESVTEGSKSRMIKQIERAIKDGDSIYTLPMDTQDYYRKNYRDFKPVNEGKTSAVYTDPKTGKGYDLQYVSSKKRWELDIMKKGTSIYSNAITTIKRNTLAEIQEWLDGYKIDSSWTKGLSESVNEGSRKKVTKSMWQKMSDDEKENALLTVFEDPDTAQKWIERKWNSLPGSVARDMYTESVGKLAKDKKIKKVELQQIIREEISKVLNEKNTYKLKTGETIKLEVNYRVKSSNYTSLSVTAYDNSGKKIGHVYFNSDETNSRKKLTSTDTSINPKWQRKGVATLMYNHVKELGYEILPSSDQTQDGIEFFKSLKN